MYRNAGFVHLLAKIQQSLCRYILIVYGVTPKHMFIHKQCFKFCVFTKYVVQEQGFSSFTSQKHNNYFKHLFQTIPISLNTTAHKSLTSHLFVLFACSKARFLLFVLVYRRSECGFVHLPKHDSHLLHSSQTIILIIFSVSYY